MNLQAVVQLVDKMSGPLQKINGVIGEFAKGVAEGAKAEAQLQKSANGATDSQIKLSGALKAVGVALAGLVSAKAIFDGFTASITAAAALDDLAAKLSTTSGNLKQLDFIAKQSGTNLNALASGFNRLTRSTAMSEEESSKQAAAFEALGISTRNVNGDLKDSNELFAEIAEEFKTMKDGPEKSALAFALFGEQAKELIPLLNQGADGIRSMREETIALGGMGDEEFTKYASAADKLMDNIDKVKLVFSNLFDTMASEIVPVFNSFVEEVISSYKENGILRNVLDGVSDVFKNVFVPVIRLAMTIMNGFTSTVQIAGKGIGALAASVAAIARGDFAGVRTIWQEYKKDVADIAAAHVDFTKRLAEGGKAAETTASNLQTRTAPALRTTQREAKEAKSALEGFLQALKMENATFGLDEAAKKMVEARAKFDQDIKAGIDPKRAQAMLNEALAQIEINKALREGADAKAKYESAGKTVAEMDMQVKMLELEATMIGKSKQERDAAIQAMVDEAEIRRLTAGLTDENAKALTEEIKAIQARRNATRETLNEDARLQSLMSNTWAEQSKRAMDDVAFLYKMFTEGKIKSEEEYVEAVEQRLSQLKDTTKKEVSEMTEFWMEAARGMQNTMSSFFFDVMQGKIDSLGKRFKSMIDKMVADALAARLADALFGKGFTTTGKIDGFLGQGLSWLSGMFGGARANGGPVQAGKMYLVGERGPEPFIPSVSGTVMSNASMKQLASTGQTFNVNITAMDSQDVRRALEKDFRWLADGVNKATRAYNLGV